MTTGKAEDRTMTTEAERDAAAFEEFICSDKGGPLGSPGYPWEFWKAALAYARSQAAPQEPSLELCPSCRADDNKPYETEHGVQMRACGRCMIQWVAKPPRTAAMASAIRAGEGETR